MVQTSEKYVEWYKKYRPRVWEDLIGQDETVKALKNDIKHDAIPTSYVFKGMYGSGKTTAAFILAKAINCENPTPESNPCNQCETCEAIDNNTQLGFTYVSGAQNGSVDSIRKLVTEQGYNQPIRKRVVILDEAHNLSSEGFDAMLIPLESENTKDVVYIICTTDVKKIKPTILSRSKTRSFNPLTTDSLNTIIRRVADKENYDVTPETVDWVRRKAQKSARQAISLLEDAYRNGITTMGYGEKLLAAIESLDDVDVIKVISEAVQAGVPADELTEQLIEDLNTILLVASGVDASIAGESIIENPEAFCEHLYGTSSIVYAIKTLSDYYSKMTTSNSARIYLQLAVLAYMEMVRKKVNRLNS